MIMQPIPHSYPTIDRNDLHSVLEAMRSRQLSMGSQVLSFEKAFAKKFGFKDAVAVSSGSAALHLALLALGVKKGDEVILPTYVCTALLNAVHYVGATPKLVDVHYEDGNMSPLDVSKKISRKTKAIIVPHMFGEPADLAPILKLGVPVVEDCAQSVGAKYQGRYVGSFGVINIFSFYATKMMATGEGGMVVSSDKKLMAKVRDLLTYDHKPSFQVRFNYKMTDIHAALGLSQLKKLDQMIARRRSLARFYTENLKGLDIGLPSQSVLTDPVCYRYVVKVRNGAAGLILDMKKKGVNCERSLFRPLHQYLHQKGFPVADQLMKDSVSLPLYPALSHDNALRIARELYNIFDK